MSFNAFISYSHAADGRLAPALRDALVRFGKKWYERRALRVFHDQSNLSSNPGLWSSIQQALIDSQFFILLASPAAAQSTWIAREVETWRQKSGAATILLVITDGTVEWDKGCSDFAWDLTTALPRTLSGVFSEEPLFVDMRWARTIDDLSLGNPRFADQVATLAARLHGREKDDLIGEDVRQRRRFVAMRAWAVAMLAAFALAAAGFGILATQRQREAEEQRSVAEEQRRIAVEQRVEAERRARISLAQALASDALRLHGVEQRADVAALLAAEAFRLNQESDGDRLGQIDQALRQILSSDFFSTVLSDGPDAFGSVAIDPVARVLVAGGASTDRGLLRFWDLRTRLSTGSIATTSEAVTALDFAGHGKFAVGGRDGHVSVWDTTDPRAPRQLCSAAALSTSQVRSLAASAAIGLVAAASDEGAIALVRVADCEVIRTLGPFEGIAWSLDFAADTPLLVGGFGSGAVRIWRVDATKDTAFATLQISDTVHAIAVDPSGSRVAVGTAGDPAMVEMWELGLGQPRLNWTRPRMFEVISLAFSADGRRLAVGTGDGALSFIDVRGTTADSPLPRQAGGVASIAFDPVLDMVATAARRGSVRIAAAGQPLGAPVILGTGSRADQVHAIGLSANGRLLASADGHAGTIHTWNPVDETPALPLLRYGSADASSKIVTVAVSANGDAIAAGTSDLFDGDNSMVLWRVSPHLRPPLRVELESAVQSLAFNADGTLLALATAADHHVTIWSLATSELSGRRVSIPAPALAVCFDADRPRLVLALRNHTLHTLNPADTTGAATIQLTRDAGALTALGCVGPDGTVATGDRAGHLKLWDETGRLIGQLRGDSSPVTGIGSDQRATLVAASDDRGNIRVWTLAKPNDPPVVIPSTLPHVASIAVGPSGEWVVAGGAAKVVKIDLTATLMRKLENRIWRNLSLDEWQLFIGAAHAPRPTFVRLPAPQ